MYTIMVKIQTQKQLKIKPTFMQGSLLEFSRSIITIFITRCDPTLSVITSTMCFVLPNALFWAFRAKNFYINETKVLTSKNVTKLKHAKTNDVV